MKHTLLLGTEASHIDIATFDDDTSKLDIRGRHATGIRPSWIDRHPTIPGLVYYNSSEECKIFLGQVREDGKITILDEANTGGNKSNHFAIDPSGKYMVVTHYLDEGAVTLVRLSADGRFVDNPPTGNRVFQPKYTKQWKHPRLESPHTHQVILRPDGEVWTPDLGCNTVWRLKVVEGEDGPELKHMGEVVEQVEGDGPRHGLVSPDGETFYLLNEVSSSLSLHPLNQELPIKTTSRHTVLPPNEHPSAPHMIASEIVLLSPPQDKPDTPTLLLCTNRDTQASQNDSIAIFKVSPDGSVQRASEPWIEGWGKHVRGMSVSRDGKYVAIAGRDNGGLLVFKRSDQEPDGLEEVARVAVDQVIAPYWWT